MQPEFVKVPMTTCENLIMIEVIRSLKQLGGRASRKEVEKEIKEGSDTIPEDYVTYEKESKRSHKKYRPFLFRYNFAIKHLLFAGFLIIPSKGYLELTEKGRKSSLSIEEIPETVRSISEPMFDSISKKNEKETEIESNEVLEAIEVIDDDSSVEIDQRNWEDDLREALQRMSPYKFELFARKLVHEMGVDIDEVLGITPVADGGIDGFGYITSDDFRTARVAIQAKRWAGKVSAPEIDKFRGAMDKYNAEFGIFITTSDFTREAISASRIGTRVITLINGDGILELVAKYQLYVTPVTSYQLNSFYFED